MGRAGLRARRREATPDLRSLLCATLVACPWLGVGIPAAAQTVVRSDTNFADAEWEALSGGAADWESGRVASGGHPGAYRRSRFRTPPGQRENDLAVAHFFTPFSYYLEQGRISCVELAADWQNFPVGALALTQKYWALRQDGQVYFAELEPDDSGPPPGSWRRFESGCLPASAFCPWGQFVDCLDHPDFSPRGASIQFGYGNRLAAFPFDGNETADGIDNWQVKIHCPAPGCDPPPPGVDLVVTKSGVEPFLHDPLRPGNLPYSFRIGYANRGTRRATGVVLTDNVPADALAVGPPWTCTPDRGPGSTCRLAVGTLEPGATGEAEFRFFPSEAAVRSRGVFNFVRIADDGRQGADIAPENNGDADHTPAFDECRPPAFLGCCALAALCHLSNPLACFGRQTPQPQPLGSPLRALAAAMFEKIDDLWLLYRLRDRVLAKTSGGRWATELYYAHDPEIKGLLVTDAGLRELALHGLAAWKGSLEALVEGRGAGVEVTADQVAAIATFLDALAAKASPALRDVIARERAAIGLAGVAGLSLDQAVERLDRLTCVASESTLCLADGRFRVESRWSTPQGDGGAAHAVRLTDDTGTFWFFDPANVEQVVKVLDGCGVNGRFWTFAAGLTNVRVVTTVTDTTTGKVRTYTNAQGRPFEPVQDTGAFACGAAAAAAPAATAVRPPRPGSTGAAGHACGVGATTLCLNGGRFRAETTWRTAQGQSGAGQAVALTGDTGYFWFFDSGNVEVLLKVLDGCGVNQRFWMFAAGLTNVEVTLRIVDTHTGIERSYGNPPGRPFSPILDTAAFSTCP